MVPPAMSTCAMIQPPKMSPFWLASAGIGMTRSAGIFPSGSWSSTRLYIVKRAAAERREPGAEDEPGVGQVGIGHDALVDRGLRLVQVGLDQRVDQRLVVRVGLALLRLSVHIPIDTLPGLLAEMAQGHLVGEDLGYRGRAARQGLAGGEARSEERRVGKECRSRWSRYD